MNYGISRSYTGFVADAPADIRAEFIRKVYSLFFTSLLATVAVGVLCAQPGIAPAMLGLWPVLLVVDIVCWIALFFARRTSGLNVALFYLFGAVQGAILGPVLTLVEQVAPGVPAQAAFLTVGVFGGLSLYALNSKRDFSYLGGFLFAALIGLIIAGIVMFFVHSTLLNTLYCLGGILIFSAFVLYDTSQIIHNLAPDEAIVGAINLYLDILNLFWFLLRLLMSFNSRD